MISFRYHVVTIVAVFMALGLGVLMGTTVVKQSVVDNLRAQAQRAINTNHDLRSSVGELRKEVRGWDSASQAFLPLLIRGQLAGTTVVLVTASDVDFSEVDGVMKALKDAGANVAGVLTVTSRMELAQDGQRVQLAGLLGVPDDSAATDVAGQAAQSVALRLADGPAQTVGADLLSQLSGGGFVVDQALGQGGLAALGGPDQPVIVLSGGRGQPAADPSTFFVPLVAALVQSSHPVVAGETVDSQYEFVSLIRKDGSIDGDAVTVDDADTMPGRVAVVLGLRNLIADGPGKCGDFGVKAGACDLVPAPTPAP